MTALGTAHLSPVSLDELLAEAELLTRVDRKYLLDPDAAAALLASLDPRTRVLSITGRRAFAYESVYFDTPDLACYRQSAHRRRRRVKIRTRSYLDSDLAFLEVKTHGRRDVTVKDRIPHDLGLRDRLDADARAYVHAVLVGSPAAGAGFGSPPPAELSGHAPVDVMPGSSIPLGLPYELVPTLVSRYQRLTLLPPEPGVRVTIDTDLSWSLPSLSHQPSSWHGESWLGTDRHRHSRRVRSTDLVVVETKAGPRPSEVDRMLWRAGIRPTSFSKYATGLAALRPNLPANPWARVLRRHLTTDQLAYAA